MTAFVPPGWAPTLEPHKRDMMSLFREREARRAAATRKEIEGEGIDINEDDDLEDDNDEILNRPPVKKLRVSTHGSYIKKWKRTDFKDFVYENRDRFVWEVEVEKEYQARFAQHFMKVAAELGATHFDRPVLSKCFDEANINARKIDMAAAKWDKMLKAGDKKKPPQSRQLDFISSLSTMPELVIALGKHLTPREILTLYSISRDFKYTVDHNMQSCIIEWGRHMVGLQGMRLCMLKPYERFFINDPLGRSRAQLSMAHITHPERPQPEPTGDQAVRPVPSLKWLQMVVHREVRLRDIMAVLARNGHRLPRGALQSLRKLWMVMDASTSIGRTQIMKNALVQPRDLFHMQLFFVKLQLLFNDPIYGPGSSMLLKLMLGQRSLTVLWAMLRRKQYTTQREMMQLKLRYDVSPTHLQLVHGAPVHGVPLLEMGMLQFEGWGKGVDHLMRPDQLVALESARRQLGLSFGLRNMMRYGHCDPVTGAPAVPSLDEMYMSDPDLPPANHFLAPEGDPNTPIHAGCGNVPFEPHMWQPKHARKARWSTLPPAERAMVLDEEWRQVSRDFAMDSQAPVLKHAKDQMAHGIRVLGLWQLHHPKKNMTTRLPAEAVRPSTPPNPADVDYTFTPPHPSAFTAYPGAAPAPPPPDNRRPGFPPITPATQRRIHALVADTALLDIADPLNGGTSGSESGHVDADADFTWHGSGSEYDSDDEAMPGPPSDDGEAAFLRMAPNLRNLERYRGPMGPLAPEPPRAATLDEHLLHLADEAPEEDEYDAATGEWFDWEGHVANVKADLVGEVQEEVRERTHARKAKRGKGKMVVRDGGDDDADDEMEEEEEEDERVKMLRGYYRMW